MLLYDRRQLIQTNNNRMDNLKTTNRWYILMIPLVIAMSSFVMGYFMAYLTMMDEYLQHLHGYSQDMAELYFTIAMALLPVGAFIATFFYGALLEAYGENKVMRIMNVIAVLAIVLQLVSLNMVVLCLSRFLMGLYCGIASGIVPSYILSLSPSFTSGIVGTYNQVAVAMGMAFAYYVGQMLDDRSYSIVVTVQILIGFPLLNILVHTVVLFLHPYDNIQRHIVRRQNNIVRKYLKAVYGANWKKFQTEIQQHKVIPIESQQPNKSTRDIYDQQNFEQQQRCCKCQKLSFILLAIALAAGNQLTGIYAILEYAKQLFLTIEDGDESQADISVLILGFFQVLVTFTSGFFINKFGRRPLMLIGMGIVCASLFAGFFITFFINEHESITVLVIFGHVFGYSISMGPICLMYAVQALQNINLVLIINWALYTIITIAGDYLIESAGLPFMFLIFAVCSILTFVFFFKYMVESMGTPRKKIWENIEGIKLDWEKSFNVFSDSHFKKKELGIKQEKGEEGMKEGAVDKTRGTI